MHTKHLLMALCLTTALAQPALAADHSAHADMAAEHGGGIFHMFRLETDVGSNTDGTSLQGWDFDGWVGTDENKLWLKSEGERAGSKLESAEFWALYMLHGIDKSIENSDRAELINCQMQGPGWAASCRHVQQVQAEYQPQTISTLGGQ